MGDKCKTDRYFITDVVRNLTQKAFIVVRDSVVEELAKFKDDEDHDEEDGPDPTSGVIIRAGDVVRFGRVCYLVKETSANLEEKAIRDISKKSFEK